MELAIAEEGLGGRLNGDLQSADGKPRPREALDVHHLMIFAEDSKDC